jgi:hypothetical protein
MFYSLEMRELRSWDSWWDVLDGKSWGEGVSVMYWWIYSF